MMQSATGAKWLNIQTQKVHYSTKFINIWIGVENEMDRAARALWRNVIICESPRVPIPPARRLETKVVIADFLGSEYTR